MVKEPETAAEVIGKTIFGAIKPLYREGERQRRGRRSQRSRYYGPPPAWSQKKIVFEVLPQAMVNAGALFGARDLYYAVRPLCYAHPYWPASKPLGYGYFSQQLLTEYQELYGEIEVLYYDPRGHLHEPHTGKVLNLGTLEVADYELPPYTYDKILYVEKEGELPKLRHAELAERYGMAVIGGKGYPVEATRALFERAEAGDYQLFVFHDADLDGYNIARVLREATRRMPGYRVDVVDLGLTVEDALEMDLDPEPFSREKDISSALRGSLSTVAKDYLYCKAPGIKGVSGDRFELNAILPDTRRVEYIERKLRENGVRGKVIPPDEELYGLAWEKYRALAAGWVTEAIDELISADEIKAEVADEFAQEFGLREARENIEDRFEADPAQSWRAALVTSLKTAREPCADAFKDAVERRVRERLAR